MNHITFDSENRERIQAVENSFGLSGKPLVSPGRVLLGQGRLMKQGHKRPQPKVFFLFNDVLVYGSLILNGRWHKNQKIIRLEHLELEDMEDGGDLNNKWLIRTPRKSFFVSAPSLEEKQSWMEHIQDCKSNLPQDGTCQPSSTFAVTWIPDQAAFRCMRCYTKFTTTTRRHHCRRCGFLVCNACSKQRAVIEHIHPTKKVRVCKLCYTRKRVDSTGTISSSEGDAENFSDEDEEGSIDSNARSSWLDSKTGTWGKTGFYQCI